MRYLILKSDKAVTTTQPHPEGSDTDKAVTTWQRATIYYQVHGRLPSVTYQIHEGDIVSAMVASARL